MTLLFDEVVYPSGERGPLWIREDDLAKLCTAFNLRNPSMSDREKFASLMNTILSDYALSRAISDLSQTLHAHSNVAINCGRVIDGLRKIEAPDAKVPEGWRVLRGALNLDEEYIAFISRESANPRHGDRTITPANVEEELSTRTWKVMNRYLGAC